ncbi:MAG: M28 family peptidase [Cyclobacteriaceae bacterium]
MRKLLLLLLPSLAACGYQDQGAPLNTSDYSKLITREFTGDLAYNTTAYVEKYWRVVGNSGFDSSIYEIVRNLKQSGFVMEDNASAQEPLTYRIEKWPMEKPTWEPVDARVMIEGEEEALLQFATNRNMIAINSYPTPKEGVSAEVVYVPDTLTLKEIDVTGKIVFSEMHPHPLFEAAIIQGGAIGLITYNNPDYIQPEKNTTSIQFRSIPLNEERKAWGIALSYAARERLRSSLAKGRVRLSVSIDTEIYPSEELTVVANVRGTDHPRQRMVFSAHVQEPGANDNASGVGVALEMATVTAQLVRAGQFSPKRTLTFLWGDEIVSTRRYVKEDSIRGDTIKWGISLDMVGENTEITGGSFLIEKMPDPSAIWTRGKDEHTEWGASEITLDDMQPHYLNDFVINRFMEQGKRASWEVKSNPFEGGSDHVPFLRADIPGVLCWHFTDQFYHTDLDRIDKVSQSTLKNVGTAALVSAYLLLNADESTAQQVIDEVQEAGIARLETELIQSQLAMSEGATPTSQTEIIQAWEDWYIQALATCSDMVDDPARVQSDIETAQSSIRSTANNTIRQMQTTP